MKRRRKTAGEQSLKALSDSTKYDGIEVAEAQLWNVPEEVFHSARQHREIFDEPEYFVVMVRASDPLLANMVRQKFYSYLFMPSPRPEQSVWLYNKALDQVKLIWSLPPAKVMAAISESPIVAKKWKRTKAWCDAFFNRNFWHFIREQNHFDHLSELEYLNLHREELIKAGCQDGRSRAPDAFDFSKVMTNKVISPEEALFD